MNEVMCHSPEREREARGWGINAYDKQNSMFLLSLSGDDNDLFYFIFLNVIVMTVRPS